jgi:hypothetical protein
MGTVLCFVAPCARRAVFGRLFVTPRCVCVAPFRWVFASWFALTVRFGCVLGKQKPPPRSAPFKCSCRVYTVVNVLLRKLIIINIKNGVHRADCRGPCTGLRSGLSVSSARALGSRCAAARAVFAVRVEIGPNGPRPDSTLRVDCH